MTTPSRTSRSNAPLLPHQGFRASPARGSRATAFAGRAFLLVAWLFSAAAARAAPAPLLSRERMLLVEGRPRFILGLYENPTNDVALRDAVEAGFNLIQCAPETAALDRIQRLGARAWVNVGAALDVSRDTARRRQHLTGLVQRLSAHPALLVWEGPDEVLWNHWWLASEQLTAEREAMGAAAAGNAALEALNHRAQEHFARGLYAEFEELRAAFWRQVGRPSPHPGARLDDAPARARQTGEGIAAGIRLLRQLDSRHAIWLNHAPRNSLADLRLYSRAADMVGCDIYPAPPNLGVGHSDLPDKGLTAVGRYTDRMRRAAPGKACAMVLQGFGWRDLQPTVKEHEVAAGLGRRPTRAESRFMAYNAILHGANAILYWGTAYLKPVEDDGSPAKDRPRLWQDLLCVARELRALEPALVTAPLPPPVVRLAETCGSIDQSGIVCTARRVADDFVLIVANETDSRLQFTLERLPAGLEGRTLYRLYAEEAYPVQGRRLRDGIRSVDVHVYATSRRFEAPAATGR